MKIDVEASIAIRDAVPEDADKITSIFLESAVHHANLDPERYWVPDLQTILARYRKSSQREAQATRDTITLIAEISDKCVGFVEAQLERSPDPMHREIVYCTIKEIAVASHYRSQGVGRMLIQAAEEWGRQKGAEFASLEFLAANTRAGIFYQERMRFRAVSITAIKRL